MPTLLRKTTEIERVLKLTELHLSPRHSTRGGCFAPVSYADCTSGRLLYARNGGEPLGMGENAARVDWAGLGVRLPWRLLSPLMLRLAVARVLDPAGGYTARAAEVAAWAAANDASTRAAELIEALTSGGSSRTPGVGLEPTT